jgi:phosphatidate cytidylyltransferase
MKRILGALILIVVFAVPVILGPPLALFIVALIVMPMCLYELYRAALDDKARLLGWIGLLGSFPYLYSIYMTLYQDDYFRVALFVLCITSLAILAAGLFLFEKGRATAMQVSLAISGFIYPLALAGFWIAIRNTAPDLKGRFWMILGLLCTFLSDTGAYYVGKNFGRHALAPILSPKKTVEGLFGGITADMLGAVLFYYLYAHFFPISSSCPVWIIPLIGGAIAILDLMGDLGVSMYKRQFQVKDMGNLIPGHGGMFDRMDGIIPVGILLYFAIQVIR